jgi:putative transposase
LLNIVDDFNNEVLGIEVDFPLPSKRVIRSLDEVISWRKCPRVIRYDNGLEYISTVLQNWANRRSSKLNTSSSAIRSRMDMLSDSTDCALRVAGAIPIDTITEVQNFATWCLWNYDHERPHMALGGFTAKQRLAMAVYFYF